jgi:VWFA-related protein
MSGRLIALIALVLALPAGPAGQDAGTPHLMLDFVAADKNGTPVTDLNPSDLEVWIGHFNVPIQHLAYVTPGTEGVPGRLIVMLLDDMTLPQAQIPRAKIAARRLVNRMGPDDEMAIVTLSGTETKSTDDHAVLLNAIDRYNVRANAVTRPDIYGEDVLKNVGSLAQQVREGRAGRKTIVAIGSGTLLDRPIPPPQAGRDLTPEWTEAMRALAFAHANFYVIDPQGVGSSRAYTGEDGFARATGGRAFLGTNDLEGAADRVLRDSANYYVVQVPDPPNSGGKGSLRQLEIRVKRRNVLVTARLAIP